MVSRSWWSCRGHDDYIGRSLARLRPSGVFVELGKRGIWSREEVLRRRPDVRHTAVFEAIFHRFSTVFIDFRPFSAVFGAFLAVLRRFRGVEGVSHAFPLRL